MSSEDTDNTLISPEEAREAVCLLRHLYPGDNITQRRSTALQVFKTTSDNPTKVTVSHVSGDKSFSMQVTHRDKLMDYLRMCSDHADREDVPYPHQLHSWISKNHPDKNLAGRQEAEARLLEKIHLPEYGVETYRPTLHLQQFSGQPRRLPTADPLPGDYWTAQVVAQNSTSGVNLQQACDLLRLTKDEIRSVALWENTTPRLTGRDVWMPGIFNTARLRGRASRCDLPGYHMCSITPRGDYSIQLTTMGLRNQRQRRLEFWVRADNPALMDVGRIAEECVSWMLVTVNVRAPYMEGELDPLDYLVREGKHGDFGMGRRWRAVNDFLRDLDEAYSGVV